MAMNRSELEKILIRFQACVRGYLFRKEVRHACGDFEDIVREIDGSSVRLKWRDAVIPIPHFIHTDGPLLEVVASVQHLSLAETEETKETGETEETRVVHCLSSERTEAETDDSPFAQGEPRLSQECRPCSSVGQDGEMQREERSMEDRMEDRDGGVMESAGESTSVWSSFGLDMNHEQSFGPPQSCLAQDVPRTPEGLRLHRNTLTMELIWLQQAIDSKKKYLALKDRLSVS